MNQYAADRICIRDLAFLYATAVDQRDYPLFESIMTEDAKIHGPSFNYDGIDEIIEQMKEIEQFKTTFHAVHNHLITIDIDTAEGEIYCVASHIYEQEGIERKLDIGIRYFDKYLRCENGWRLYDRELKLDWKQDLPIQG